MVTQSPPADGDRYVAAHSSAEFQTLRRRSQAFLLWASVVFFGWWFTGSALATFAPDFFRREVGGPVNVGLLFVLLSFVLVVTISGLYLRYARTRLDPLGERVRADLEAGPEVGPKGATR
ncbi:uncharacterized membrane protein (DUF485 family) [Actinomadura pelletieri DSM 43383]|uniref:Uncharacterized membrane protein (DUF485 family) n=1 Tax=Actinomadura pelletieri DSM 43383 TaxID=1120940 RepID=A0A495QKU0_9ACTN|nr:DUF485 domain-containing protein [Actinomadura pelletieri]RKS73123.1 uncharacterized membrane protein (DUF485 family) [Actinomadura pelletieri DSM 43383]